MTAIQSKNGTSSLPAPAGAGSEEVVARPTRRRFSAQDKLRLLQEAERCAPGELGALLRREGLYASHLARPPLEVFERWKYLVPNFSLRMSNLPAALARAQLGEVLRDRCRRWNQNYAWMQDALQGAKGLRLPHRPAREQYVASSIQFAVTGLNREGMQAFLARCAAQGVHIKWFGAEQPAGFTSAWQPRR